MAGKLAEALVRAGVLAADAYDIEEELGLRKDNSVNLTATLSDGGLEIHDGSEARAFVTVGMEGGVPTGNFTQPSQAGSYP